MQWRSWLTVLFIVAAVGARCYRAVTPNADTTPTTLSTTVAQHRTSRPTIPFPSTSATRAHVHTATGTKHAPTHNRAALIQQALKLLGYNTGPVDGVVGPLTTTAISDFQLDHHLVPDGILGPSTFAVLASELEKRCATPLARYATSPKTSVIRSPVRRARMG